MAKSFQRFTLHVQLQHIEPPIWRRIEVEGTESLRKLHHILLAAFGWEDTHLHDFLIDGMTYAMFEVDDVLDFADPGTSADDRKVRLQKGRRCPIDLCELRCDRFRALPAGEVQKVPDQMNDARLDRRFREHRGDRFREALHRRPRRSGHPARRVA